MNEESTNSIIEAQVRIPKTTKSIEWNSKYIKIKLKIKNKKLEIKGV
jgi:hypothetical protein